MKVKSFKSCPQMHRRPTVVSPCGREGTAKGVGGVAGARGRDRQAVDPLQEAGGENTNKSLTAIMTTAIVSLVAKCFSNFLVYWASFPVFSCT